MRQTPRARAMSETTKVAEMIASNPVQVIARNIRLKRKSKCWSQESLAILAGLHPTEISRLERGLREPRFVTIMRVATALGTTPDGLLVEVRS